jgi:hypothetical protein
MEDAARLVDEALRDVGITDAEVRTTVVDSEAEAAERGFVGSPTILIDGRDPIAPADPRPAFACRVYATADGLNGVPDVRELRRAIKEAADRA